MYIVGGSRIPPSACSRLSIVPTTSTTLTGTVCVVVIKLAPSRPRANVEVVNSAADLKCLIVSATAVATVTVPNGCVANNQPCDINRLTSAVVRSVSALLEVITVSRLG